MLFVTRVTVVSVADGPTYGFLPSEVTLSLEASRPPAALESHESDNDGEHDQETDRRQGDALARWEYRGESEYPVGYREQGDDREDDRERVGIEQEGADRDEDDRDDERYQGQTNGQQVAAGEGPIYDRKQEDGGENQARGEFVEGRPRTSIKRQHDAQQSGHDGGHAEPERNPEKPENQPRTQPYIDIDQALYDAGIEYVGQPGNPDDDQEHADHERDGALRIVDAAQVDFE